MSLRNTFTLTFVLLASFFSVACSGDSPTLYAGRSLDVPAIYRVSVTAESSFSGAASNLRVASDLTGAFKITPTSNSSVEVEPLYLAVNVRDGEGEPVALSLEGMTGKKAVVEMSPSGVVSGVRGDEALLDAPVPLISVREVIWSLFPPLPDESVGEDDTWTGDMPIPFANLGGPPHRMRYVLQSADSRAEQGRIQGYELSVRPRAFSTDTPGGGVSGEGDLDVEFEGELRAEEGYESIERTAEFDTNYIRLQDGRSYANGNLHLESFMQVERLSSAEQFGLDTGAEK